MDTYFIVFGIGFRIWWQPRFWSFYWGKTVKDLGPITIYTGRK